MNTGFVSAKVFNRKEHLQRHTKLHGDNNYCSCE